MNKTKTVERKEKKKKNTFNFIYNIYLFEFYV